MREEWEYERMPTAVNNLLDETRFPIGFRFLLRARDVFLTRGQYIHADRCRLLLSTHWGFKVESMLLRGALYVERWYGRYQSKYLNQDEVAQEVVDAERDHKRQRRLELEDRWDLNKTT